MKTAKHLAAAAAVLLLSHASDLTAQQPQNQTLADEWHAVFKSGRKCGYVHVGFATADAGGRKAVRGETVVEMDLGAAGPDSVYRSVTVSVETADTGRLVSMQSRRGFGDKIRTASCVVNAHLVRIEVEGSPPSVTTVPGGLPGPYALFTKCSELAAAGVQFDLASFDPFTGSIDWKRSPAGEESVPVFGKTMRLKKFEAAARGAPPVFEWRDDLGRLVRTYDPRDDVNTLLADSAAATGVSSSYLVSVAVSGVQRSGDGPGSYFFEGPLASYALEAPGQKTEPAESGVKVSVDRPRPFPPTLARPVSGGAEAASFTGFDRFVDWMNPEVQKKIALLTEKVPDALDASAAAAVWVGGFVTRLRGGPYLTAPEALSAGSSSSFGRAALCCAICRGASVPSRVVAGLKDDGDSMELSFWVEAFVGAWVALDPDSADGFAGNRHVRLKILDMRGQHPEESFNALAWDIQKSRVRRG